MRNIISFSLAGMALAALSLALSGCGGDSSGTSKKTNPAPDPSRATTPKIAGASPAAPIHPKCPKGELFYKEWGEAGGLHIVRVVGSNPCNSFRSYTSNSSTKETWRMYFPDRLPLLPDHVRYLYTEFARNPYSDTVIHQNDYVEKSINGDSSVIIGRLNKYDPNADHIATRYAFCDSDRCEIEYITSESPRYQEFFNNYDRKNFRDQMLAYQRIATKSN